MIIPEVFSVSETVKDYYSSLPEEVQESIDEHEDEFHSLDEMKAFAEEQMYLS